MLEKFGSNMDEEELYKMVLLATGNQELAEEARCTKIQKMMDEAEARHGR